MKIELMDCAVACMIVVGPCSFSSLVNVYGGPPSAPHESVNLLIGTDRTLALKIEYRPLPCSSQSIRVNSLYDDPGWNPIAPPSASSTLKLTAVVVGRRPRGCR